jgi:2-oxoglutarate dehydrogenase E1 component
VTLDVSSIEDFTSGSFQETIDDTTVNKADVKTLVFVTGKFYYDITAERNGRTDVAVVRIEQLFPLPVEQLKAIIAYPNADDYVWAQEEPKNMGAYSFMLMNSTSKMEISFIKSLFSASIRKLYKSKTPSCRCY